MIASGLVGCGAASGVPLATQEGASTILHSVEFRANGGIPATQTADAILGEPYGALFERIERPTKLGLDTTIQFIGWFTTPYGSGVQIHATDIVTADSPRILYARWRGNWHFAVSLSFSGNGGIPERQSISPSQVSNATFAEAFALIEEPVRAGYRFTGWVSVVTGVDMENGQFIAREHISPILPTDPTPAIGGYFRAQWAVDPDAPFGPVWRTDLTLTSTHISFLIGTGERAISPFREITRAEVATILLRVMSDESRSQFWTLQNDFPDVSPDDWFNNAVSTVTAAGLMEGVNIGGTRHFNPSDVLTRAEIATIIVRFLNMGQTTIPNTNFRDVSANHWAWNSINLVTELGWMVGSGGCFRPSAVVNRTEVSIIMNRVLGRTQANIDRDRMLAWDDNTIYNRFFWDVQIASNSAPGAPAMYWEALQRPNAQARDVFQRSL